MCRIATVMEQLICSEQMSAREVAGRIPRAPRRMASGLYEKTAPQTFVQAELRHSPRVLATQSAKVSTPPPPCNSTRASPANNNAGEHSTRARQSRQFARVRIYRAREQIRRTSLATPATTTMFTRLRAIIKCRSTTFAREPLISQLARRNICNPRETISTRGDTARASCLIISRKTQRDGELEADRDKETGGGEDARDHNCRGRVRVAAGTIN